MWFFMDLTKMGTLITEVPETLGRAREARFGTTQGTFQKKRSQFTWTRAQSMCVIMRKMRLEV